MLIGLYAMWLAVPGRALAGPSAMVAVATEPSIPRYEHIFLIIAENHGMEAILGPDAPAPHLKRLAAEYGLARRFYGEVHPSEGNYVAMLAGSSSGIHDDDPWFCKPDSRQPECAGAAQPGYADHTVHARTLVEQLEEHGLAWKVYLEDLPEPGSLAVFWPTLEHPVPGTPAHLYAVKHNGFANIAHVRADPLRLRHIVGFAQLESDLAAGRMPNYAHIVPNQCHDMHGLAGTDVPVDCSDPQGVIAQGDRVIGGLVERIMRSTVWTAAGNVAIVITFDEDGYSDPRTQQGCCGFEPASAANFGGGHIPTIVITNHGPRGVVDDHPYNHYSLLRTTERAFGIDEYVGHAGDVSQGVTSMAPLFAVTAGGALR